jgi:hypothetical protein
VGLASRVSRCTEVGSGGARLGEVAGEDWLQEGAEDDLGATSCCQHAIRALGTWLSLRSLGKSHPKDEDELEGVVKGYQYQLHDFLRCDVCVALTEPIDGADGALKDSQEGIHNPVCEPLQTC